MILCMTLNSRYQWNNAFKVLNLEFRIKYPDNYLTCLPLGENIFVTIIEKNEFSIDEIKFIFYGKTRKM